MSDFKVLNTEVIQQPEQFILVEFSDPLNETQNLNGLLRLENNSSLRYIIENNAVKIYPPVRQSGTRKLSVEAGIKNILNYKMTQVQVSIITLN